MSHTTSAVILAFNEELHIERCIRSARRVADRIYVVDCYSTDSTVALATQSGAQVLQRAWTNHSDQFNWALDRLPKDTEWVVRIDADEFLDDELCASFNGLKQQSGLAGVNFLREIRFLGTPIRHGGLYPIAVLRAFRFGQGRCESRWMDEHIIVKGPIASAQGRLVDENLHPLDWWIGKHNRYASLEAVEMLNLKFGFLPGQDRADLAMSRGVAFKRWIKQKVYGRMPSGTRAYLYYLYRKYLRLGILGGEHERMFHFLQGYWYRYLIDAKVAEVERYMRRHAVDARAAIARVLQVAV